MNKISLLLLTALLSAFAMPSYSANVQADEEFQFNIPSGKSGSGHDSYRKWSKPKICRATKSTTCVVCSSAGKEGIITAIHVASGTVGGFAVVLDTGAIPSAGIEPATSDAGQLLVQQKTCEYTLATVDTNKGSCGKWEAQGESGIPFSNGATVCNKAADFNTVVLFRELKR
jgi:hypothetical protein